MTSSVDVDRAAAFLQGRLPSIPGATIVAGSGLGALDAALTDTVRVPFSDVPGFPSTSVAGHSGAFVHGRLGADEVLVQAGRFHVYEGHPMDIVVAPIRVLATAGAETVILTNAAGSIHPLMHPGDVVLLDDLVNLQFRSPLTGAVREGEVRFPDMSAPFHPWLRGVLRQAGRVAGAALKHGTYASVTGPAYETRAEIRMLRRLGADLVGMSTVPEVLVAASRGLRCGALSLVTNRAAGLSATPLAHDEVLEMGRMAGKRVVAILREALPVLSRGRTAEGAGT